MEKDHPDPIPYARRTEAGGEALRLGGEIISAPNKVVGEDPYVATK